MKAIKIGSIILLILSIIVFGGFEGYSRYIKDENAPVIYIPDSVLKVSVTDGEEKLLEGVTAIDNVDGDVSDSIFIEKISPFTRENTRIVTYVALDSNMNVSKVERTMVYEDYEQPTFYFKQPLVFVAGQNINILGRISANSSLDGTLTDKIKISLNGSINASSIGIYPIEIRVTDSVGKQVYLQTELEIYDKVYADLGIQLKKYLIYVEKGADFEAESYIRSVIKQTEEDAGTVIVDYGLKIESDVNTNVAGVYHVEYLATFEEYQGKTRLVVIVY